MDVGSVEKDALKAAEAERRLADGLRQSPDARREDVAAANARADLFESIGHERRLQREGRLTRAPVPAAAFGKTVAEAMEGEAVPVDLASAMPAAVTQVLPLIGETLPTTMRAVAEALQMHEDVMALPFDWLLDAGRIVEVDVAPGMERKFLRVGGE